MAENRKKKKSCIQERILVLREVTDGIMAEDIVEENNERPTDKRLHRIVAPDYLLVDDAKEVFQENGILVTSTIF